MHVHLFNFFGAASIQVWLLFESGLYAKSWVCKACKNSLVHVKMKVRLDIAIVPKLFQM